jgi:multiple sugar transport system permease protein
MTTSTTMTAPTLVKTAARRRTNWQKQGVAYLFLLPALLVFTLVTWYPILNTILYSFQKVNLGGVQGWVGFQTMYACLGTQFLYAWKNTLIYVLLSLVMGQWCQLFWR